MGGGLLKAQWYDDREILLRRMEDELYRSRRHTIEFSIFLVTFTRPLVTDLRAVLSASFRQLDFAGMLSGSDVLFAIAAHRRKWSYDSVATPFEDAVFQRAFDWCGDRPHGRRQVTDAGVCGA